MNKISLILCSIVLVASTAFADPLFVRDSLSHDSDIPETVRILAMNDIDRHTSGMMQLIRENVNSSIFTLYNRDTFMVFEVTDKTCLVMYLQLSEDTGLVEMLWSKNVGTDIKAAK